MKAWISCGGMVSIGWNSRRSWAYSASSVPSAACQRAEHAEAEQPAQKSEH
jgi:hypothetical protein